MDEEVENTEGGADVCEANSTREPRMFIFSKYTENRPPRFFAKAAFKTSYKALAHCQALAEENKVDMVVWPELCPGDVDYAYHTGSKPAISSKSQLSKEVE